MIHRDDIEKLRRDFAGKEPQEIIRWGVDFFGTDKIALSSSLGAEDQVLTDMIVKINATTKQIENCNREIASRAIANVLFF